MSAIYFEDKVFSYDGKEHSIFVSNLPEGLVVSYEGNGQTEIGEYTVKAIIKYSSGETLTSLEATLKIVDSTDVSGVTFVDKTFEYDGNEHSIYVENLPEGVTVEYKYNGQKYPGRYVVKATLIDEHGNILKYLAARIIITGEGVDVPTEGPTDEPTKEELIDVSNVTFESLTVPYDGEEHEIVCGNLPDGVIVTYLMNKQTEPGEYNAIAILTDAKTLTELTRLFATLTINAVEEPEPTPDAVPTTGFHLVINGTTYVALTSNGAALDPTFTEYYAMGVVFNEGDVVTLFDADAEGGGAYWAIQTPDTYSSGSWTGTPDGIICNSAGTFDVYVKMKYAEDQIYFGLSQ